MGIPGSPNPLLMRRAAAAGGDAYQIEKSLRFNDPDEPVLKRLFYAGNTRTWTWAAWVKRSSIGVQHNLFSAFGGDSNNHGYLVLESDDMIAFDQRISGTWSNSTKTNRLFRDTSAWFHITFVFDSTNATEADRIRLFINGERVTSWNDAPNCTQHLEGKYNSAMWHEIGKGQGNSSHMDGYLADVHFMDGLALSPSSFGEYDASRSWNPATFKLLGRNNGATWSGMVTGTEDSGWTKTSVFNGNTGNSGRASAGNTLTFTPTTKMERVSSLRVFADHRYGSQSSATLLVNGTNYSYLVPKTSGAWVEIPETTLETIAWSSVNTTSGGSGDAIDIGAIEVDGEILMDGANHTDSVTKLSVLPNSADRLNPNNGTKWSDYLVSSTGSFFSGMPATNLFNGNLANGTDANSTSATLTFTPPTPISYNGSVILHCSWTHFQTSTAVITHSDDSTTSTTLTDVKKFKVIDTGVGTIKSLALTTSSGYLNLGGIEVDGHLLIDSSVDNSFHLKFNNTTSNANVGINDFRGKIADSTGAIPILKTSDVYGEVKSSGNTTDSLSSYLKLAIPGDNVTNTTMDLSSSNHDVTHSSTPVTTTTSESRLYGTSLNFGDPGNADTYLTLPEHADFQFGTGDFCIEMWVYYQKTSRETYSLWGQKNNPEDGVMLRTDGHGEVLKAFFTWAGGGSLQCNHDFNDKWTHIALTRASGTFKLWVNGVEKASNTASYDMDGSVAPRIGSNVPSGSTEYFAGKLQDIRVYKGHAKYTANFRAPNKDAFTVTNINALDPEITVANADAKTKPIYVTSGDQGGTKGSGYNTDAYKSLLVFAVPGDTIADISHVSDLRNSGSALSITNRNSVDLLTTQSRFYGTSMYFDGNDSTNDGTGDAIHIDDSQVTIGTGELTVEFWMRADSLFNNFVIFDCRHGTNNWPTNDDGFTIQSNASGMLWSDGMSGGGAGGHFATATGVIQAETWHHIAATRDSSSVMRFFVDGKVVVTKTSATWDFDQTRMCWGNSASFGEGYKGFLQDIRVYKGSGACKYVEDFNVPTFGAPGSIDVLTDTPTNYGTASSPEVGGELRGNYCTLNALDQAGDALSEGNLKLGYSSNSHRAARGTWGLTSGKWYWEYETTVSGTSYHGVGTKAAALSYDFGSLATFKDFWYLHSTTSDKDLFTAGTDTSNYLTGTSSPVGEIQQVMLDMDNYKLKFGVNNTWGAEIDLASTAGGSTSSYKELFPIAKRYSWSGYVNFGQRPYKYAAPAGYKSLCTQNLDDTFSGADVNNPSKFFAINTYAGLGTGIANPIGGMKFGPDLIWTKARSYTDDHALSDQARGVSKTLATNSTAQQISTAGSFVTAFNSDGYTLGDGATVNGSSTTYVSWCWDAGASAATASTDGTKTPTAQWVNTAAGFTMGTYDGDLTNCTIGTGLTSPLDFLIVKRADGSDGWIVYHKEVGHLKYLRLDSADAEASTAAGQTNYWNSTAPADDKFTIGNGGHINGNGSSNLFLGWTSVPGFSAFGEYYADVVAGNGPFVWTGFRPAYILSKRKDSDVGANWSTNDIKRGALGGGNVYNAHLYANGNYADWTHDEAEVDFLSNGFKIRGNGTGTMNRTSTAVYVYICFAEHPFKTARAR